MPSERPTNWGGQLQGELRVELRKRLLAEFGTVPEMAGRLSVSEAGITSKDGDKQLEKTAAILWKGTKDAAQEACIKRSLPPTGPKATMIRAILLDEASKLGTSSSTNGSSAASKELAKKSGPVPCSKTAPNPCDSMVQVKTESDQDLHRRKMDFLEKLAWEQWQQDEADAEEEAREAEEADKAEEREREEARYYEEEETDESAVGETDEEEEDEDGSSDDKSVVELAILQHELKRERAAYARLKKMMQESVEKQNKILWKMHGCTPARLSAPHRSWRDDVGDSLQYEWNYG
ncbi:hypothetical protein MMC13_001181 [Lambiella insularis]|nr:hypothetical protein [Lambiella insularis]